MRVSAAVLSWHMWIAVMITAVACHSSDPKPKDVKDASADAAADAPDSLDEAVARYGGDCRVAARCGDLIGIDCNSAVDGPYYYIRADSYEEVAACGGFCQRGCTNCPPAQWTCGGY